MHALNLQPPPPQKLALVYGIVEVSVSSVTLVYITPLAPRFLNTNLSAKQTPEMYFIKSMLI